MPTACIQHDHSRIHLKSERLEVWGPNPETGQEQLLRELPIRDLDRLIIFESVQISSAALAALLREGIPVNLISWNGQFLGGFLPPQTAHGLARLRQYRQTQDGPFALQMAGRIVSAKLYNQRRVLQRLAAARPAADAPGNASTGRDKLDASDVGRTSGLPVPACAASVPEAAGITVRPEAGLRSFSPVPSTLAWLDTLFASINRSQSIDELRGHEGAAAARYFQAWASFLPSEFPFERRSTRPPLNPVNACISYAAMMVYNEAVSFLHAHGLDPSLGLLHAPENGRWSLALDLMEPFRPALVEALALDLFSHQMLNASHFETRDGGVFLNAEGRKKLTLQYERRMERQFMSECAGHRTTLRLQLENQAVMYKSALEKPETFEPFLMN